MCISSPSVLYWHEVRVLFCLNFCSRLSSSHRGHPLILIRIPFNANPQSQNQSQNSVAPALCRHTSPQNLISTASSCCVSLISIIIAPSSYEQSPRSVMHLPPPPCSALKDKALRVQACLAHDPVSLWELRELALSKGGLVNGT